MKILVLAGGYDQKEFIQELKKRGHQVMLVDYLEKPLAADIVEKHYQISTLDVEAVLEVAMNEKVDMVTTACTDQALVTAAYVSEKLNLEPFYISYETAILLTDKAYMKKIMRENEIPTSDYYVIYSVDEIKSLEEKLSYPVVVKPCDCNSSKGVVKVEEKTELLDFVQDAISLSRSKKVIIEGYNEGREISIDAWIAEEKVELLSVSETKKIPNTFTICQSKYISAEFTENIIKKIIIILEKIRIAYNLENCPLLVQAIEKNGKISIIEFSARMGGGTKYPLIQKISGIDIMKLYVDRILGNRQKLQYIAMSKKNYEMNYVYARQGIIERIIGIDELLENGVIEKYCQYKYSGDRVTSHKTSGDRVAGFLISANTIEDLIRKRKKILKKIEVLDKSGVEMMLRKIYEN